MGHNSRMKKELDGKIYKVTVSGTEMLVKAKTKQGAIAYAATKLIQCEYADQNTLYEMTKKGVVRVDTTAKGQEPQLPGMEPITIGTAPPPQSDPGV